MTNLTKFWDSQVIKAQPEFNFYNNSLSWNRMKCKTYFGCTWVISRADRPGARFLFCASSASVIYELDQMTCQSWYIKHKKKKTFQTLCFLEFNKNRQLGEGFYHISSVLVGIIIIYISSTCLSCRAWKAQIENQPGDRVHWEIKLICARCFVSFRCTS